MSRRNKKKKNYRYKPNEKKTKLSNAAMKQREKAKEPEDDEWKAYDFLRSDKSKKKTEDLNDSDEPEIIVDDKEETQETPNIILMDDDDETVVDTIDSDDYSDEETENYEGSIEDGNPIVKDLNDVDEEEEDFNIYKDFSIKTREEDDDSEKEEESNLSKTKKNSKVKKIDKKKDKTAKEEPSEETKYKNDKKTAKNAKKDKKKKKKKKFRILKRIILTLFILGIIAVIAAVAVVYAIFKTDKWAITREELLSEAGAIIYDKNGNELVRLTGDEINKKVELNEMSKVPDAFISIEDER